MGCKRKRLVHLKNVGYNHRMSQGAQYDVREPALYATYNVFCRAR